MGLLTRSLAHLFIIFFIFSICQILNHAVLAFLWPLAPDMSLRFLWLDRLAYGLSFVLPGGLLFFWLLPQLLRADTQAGLWLRGMAFSRALGLGLSCGLAMFLTIWLLIQFSSETQSSNPGLSAYIKSHTNYLIHFTIATGTITPIFEEFFYRAGLITHLERFRLAESWNALCWPGRDPDRPGPGHLLLLAPALLFALAHHEGKRILFFAWGVIFSLLYLRAGLTGAISAHAMYNSMLVLMNGLGD